MKRWFPLLVGCAAVALFHGVVVFSELFPDSSWEHGGLGYWTNTVWDENWYCHIAKAGYDDNIRSYRGLSNLPFSPGFPMLLRLGHVLTQLSVEAVRLPIAAVLFLLSCALLWRILFLLSENERRNRWVMALFVFSPGSMYFLTGYAESLYLPLLLLFFVALLRGRYLAASVAASCALFTRNPAIVLVGTLCVTVVLENLQTHRLTTATARSTRSLALYVPVCALGMAGYVWMTYAKVGDPLAIFKSYSAWFPVEQSGLQAFVFGAPAQAIRDGWQRAEPGLVTAGLVIALLPPLVFTHRASMPHSLVTFSAIAWLFFMYQNPPIHETLNVLRWLAPVFPLHIAIVFTLERLGRGRALASVVVLAVFVFLYAVNVYRFIHGQWVS